MTRFASLACILACVFVLPACIVYEGSSRTLSARTNHVVAASGISEIAVETGSADVVLNGVSGNRIAVRTYVEGTRSYAASRAVQITREGHALQVWWPSTGVSWCFGFCDTRVEIDYPSSFPVNVVTSSGDVRSTAALGVLTVHTSSGDVRIDDAARDLLIHTSSGDVNAILATTWHGRAITLGTSSGDVRLVVPQNFQGSLSTNTDSGDVHDDANMSGSLPVRIETDSGDISVERE